MKKNKQIKSIIQQCLDYKKADDEKQKAFNHFHEILCGGSVMSVLEIAEADAFIEGIKHFDYKLWDILNWYCYDCGNVKNGGRTIKGKKYPAKTADDLVDIYFAYDVGKDTN